MKQLKPVHPGEILKQEFMLPLKISCNQLAKSIGVTPARISEITRFRRGITAETALRLAKFFGTDAQSWMNLQNEYELSLAKQNMGKEVSSIQPLINAG